MLVVIDNYDSFTFNLVQYLAEITQERLEIKVIRNDAHTVGELRSWNPSHIVISPGPCTPNEAGISISVVKELSGSIPILGVCLGHQAIVQAFGGKVIRAPRIMHGKTSKIRHKATSIFKSLPQDFIATRYHSLIADPQSIPGYLEVLAHTLDDEQEIMAVCHREHPGTIGVQFHPEAILTEHGKTLLADFLAIGES